MTTYFISRHKGAIDWIAQQGIHIDKTLSHLNPQDIQKGDIIVGTLPIHLVAKVCQQGGRYFHLTLNLPEALRGKELSAEDMQNAQAQLEEFNVEKL